MKETHSAKALLHQCHQQARPHYRWLTLLGVGQTLNTLAFAGLMAWLINEAAYLGGTRWQQPLFWLLLCIVLLLQGLLPWLRARLGIRASLHIRQQVRQQLLAHSQQLGVQVFGHFTPSEMSNLLSQEIDSLADYFTHYLPQQRLAVIAPLLIVLAIAPLNWLVALLLALTAPLIPLFMVLVGQKAAAASRRNLVQLNRLGSLLADRLRQLQTLQLGGSVQSEQNQLLRQSLAFRDATLRVLRLAFLSGAVLEFFSAISVALVAVYLGLFFLGKYQLGHYGADLTLGDGVFLLMLAPEFYLPLRRMGALYHARADALSVAEHVLALFTIQPARVSTISGPIERIDSLTLDNLQTGVNQQPIGLPFSLRLERGEAVLICGPSGCGKSTLLDTIAGLLPALSGQLLCNQQPVQPYQHPPWQQRIGYMTQQAELAFASIRANLCLGRTFSDEQLMAALALAQIDDLVQQLPGQLDYPISERGGLSGGQAQRIALARIWLHQPDLLLLDEATSNLDAPTANLFMQSLHRYCQQGGMVLMVSHRVQEQTDLSLFSHIIQLHEPPGVTPSC